MQVQCTHYKMLYISNMPDHLPPHSPQPIKSVISIPNPFKLNNCQFALPKKQITSHSKKTNLLSELNKQISEMSGNTSIYPEHIQVLLKREEFDDSYVQQEQINGGQSQVVFLNHNRHGAVAVKVINTTDAYGRAIDNLNSKLKQELKEKRPKWTARELLNLLLVQGHPGVVWVHSAFFDGPEQHNNKYFFIVMEKGYCDLKNFVREHYRNLPSEDEVRPIMQQAICILHYLHRQGVVHRDIKAENFLLFKDDSSPQYSFKYDRVKIADFGFSKYRLNSVQKSKVGTLPYAAPEILDRTPEFEEGYDGLKVDVWSLGVLLHFLLCGVCPFGPFQEDNVSTSMVDQVSISDRIIGSTEPYAFTKQNTNLSEDCIDLLKKMLNKNHQERITILEAKNHPWTQQNFNNSYAESLDRMVNTADFRASRVEDPDIYQEFEQEIKQKVAYNIEWYESDGDVPQHVVDSIWNIFQ
eukprot:TRINITY_DN1435_c0_g1_i1.p1 TRINITY_DN1435_c0_g1~~TRINITY_DN1435_c0_g1_i1.p1  ORF type:complete len:468 (-),score=40.35 TRINITY_DN1435_c0_g1_i1:2200-3603(-)